MVRCCFQTLALVLAAIGLTGCAVLPGHRAQSVQATPGQGMTFVADGSGDLRQVSDALANVAKESRAPMSVHRVQWSHGKGAVFPDLYDADHHATQGQALANQIIAFRKANPNQRVCLIGYSSGASVALAAAERMPPDTIDRFILLSPSVAAKHDLRPSLRASREGIDAFHSEWDFICLVLFAMGTGDGVGQNVAGRTGFVPPSESSQDQQIYRGLRQHFWQGSERWSGHDGGHFGCFSAEFLRNQVLPKLCGGQ
jgi:pimeloyl-ACP methyl ester carboxylesterase